jgi:hypothetical protein
MTVQIKTFIIQTSNDFQSQLMMEYIEMTIEIIFISVGVFILISAPLMLFYFALDNYFKWKISKKIINEDFCFGNYKSHSTYISQTCEQYKSSFLKLIGNVFGLIAWNLFSLLYISINFTNFRTGITDYFLFPFEVIELYKINYSIDTLYQIKTQGLYMFIISMMSMIFFQLGKYAAEYLIENNLSLSLKGKLFISSSLLKNLLKPTILKAQL